MTTAFVLPVGTVNILTGATCYDWTIYDEHWKGSTWAFLTDSRFLMFSSREDSFQIGEEVTLRGNDTQRLLKKVKIKDVCAVDKDTLLAMLLKNEYDYYPARAFKKKRFSNKLQTSYSIKGITNQ